jgi:hypothetical protein
MPWRVVMDVVDDPCTAHAKQQAKRDQMRIVEVVEVSPKPERGCQSAKLS